MLKFVLAAAAALPLAACATTATTATVSEADMAQCRQMQAQMGIADRHDHAEAKGHGAHAMNMTHHRCRRMLHES